MGQDFLDIQYASVLVTVELVLIEKWELDMVMIGYTNISSAKAPCSGKYLHFCLNILSGIQIFHKGRWQNFKIGPYQPPLPLYVSDVR